LSQAGAAWRRAAGEAARRARCATFLCDAAFARTPPCYLLVVQKGCHRHCCAGVIYLLLYPPILPRRVDHSRADSEFPTPRVFSAICRKARSFATAHAPALRAQARFFFFMRGGTRVCSSALQRFRSGCGVCCCQWKAFLPREAGDEAVCCSDAYESYRFSPSAPPLCSCFAPRAPARAAAAQCLKGAMRMPGAMQVSYAGGGEGAH